jgi:hypothetical protein
MSLSATQVATSFWRITMTEFEIKLLKVLELIGRKLEKLEEQLIKIEEAL